MKIALFILLVLLATSGIKAQVGYDDNRKVLDDARVNPTFALTVKQFMDSAVKAGFRPVVHEAFRSRERAKELNRKNASIGRAAAAVSIHSFGLAVDIWLANNKGEVFSFDPKDYKEHKADRFSYATWLKFIKIGEHFGLINAYKHDDTDHWELHPNWSKSDWVSAKKVALPVYIKNPGLTEIERLQQVWADAGL